MEKLPQYLVERRVQCHRSVEVPGERKMAAMQIQEVKMTLQYHKKISIRDNLGLNLAFHSPTTKLVT